MSRRPAISAFPIFIQKSLHSHYIDHLSWIGNSGHILSRSYCFDSPAKRVFRLFRPTFFDTFTTEDAMAADHLGVPVLYPAEAELFSRWTMAASPENIGDGVVCVDNELVLEHGQLKSKRMLYMPTVEPAIHIYALDASKKQENLEAERHAYKIRLGEEVVVEEDKRKNAQLRAIDVQSAGRGWMVSVGELEKLMVWKKAEPLDINRIRLALQRQIDHDENMSEDGDEDGLPDLPSGSHQNGTATNGVSPEPESQPNGQTDSQTVNGDHAMQEDEVDMQPGGRNEVVNGSVNEDPGLERSFHDDNADLGPASQQGPSEMAERSPSVEYLA